MLPLTYSEFFNTFPSCIRPLGLDAAMDEFQRKHNVKILLASINGAHLWGLQTPKSDIDVHGIYLKPTLEVIDLRPGDDTIQCKVDIGTDNPELEFQMFELQKFLTMLMYNNGNMLTLATSPFVIRDKNYFDPDGRYGWAKLAEHFMTKEMYYYFAGYAKSQKKRALSQRGSKALVYTYREMFTGLHLMKYGRMQFWFEHLLNDALAQGWYTPGGLLFKYYTPGKGHRHVDVDLNDWNQFFAEWEVLDEKLKEETEKSMLPDSFDGYELCNKVLKVNRILSAKEMF